jgi:hypothetical protein
MTGGGGEDKVGKECFYTQQESEREIARARALGGANES